MNTKHKKIKNVIFDFGGVISIGSRRKLILDYLCENNKERKFLSQFFNSEYIKETARGKHSAQELYYKIIPFLNNATIDKIHLAFINSCKAKQNIINYITQLKKEYSLYLISDSLPPYSKFIKEQYNYLFKKMFFSDKLQSRKSEKLFNIIKTSHPEIFIDSIYIDDNKTHVDRANSFGLFSIQFSSFLSLSRDIEKLKTTFEQNSKVVK